MQSKYGNTNINSEWLRSSLLGQPNGIAELGPDGLVPSSQLGGLDNLLDVTLTSPVSDGDVLVYNSLTGLWTNQTFLSGGEGLAQTLAIGQASGGNDILMTEGDDIVFQYSTFGNFINTNPLTADRNILFPDASGTVALLSDIPAGAGDNIYNADGTLTGNRTVTTGTFLLNLSNGSDDLIFDPTNNRIGFKNAGIGDKTGWITTNGTLTADQTYTLQNASGTLAFLSDIPSLAGYVTGSGTTNYVPRWTPDGTTLGNSSIQSDGTTASMGTGSPNSNVDLLAQTTRVVGIQVNNTGTGALHSGVTCITGGASTNNVGIELQVRNASQSNVGLRMRVGGSGAQSLPANTDVGVLVGATGTTHENIGGIFQAVGGTSNYALQLIDGTEGVGKVLTSDALGKASWQTISTGVSGSGTTNYIPKWTPDGNTLGDSLIQESIFNTVGINVAPNAITLLNIASDKNVGLSLDQTQASSTAHSTGIYGSARGANTSVFGNTGTRGSAVLATQYNVGVHGHGGSGIFTVLPFNLGSVGVVGQATSSIVGKDIATFAGYSTSSHADDTYGIYLDVSNPGAGDAYIGVLKDGSQGDGKALVSDSVGRATWETITYDSGWKPLPFWNGSFGLPNTGNVAYVPRIRVTNRTVHIDGTYVLPMPTALGGTTLDTNGLLYVSNFYSDIYSDSAQNGFQLNVTGRQDARTYSPILPTNLRPQNSKYLSMSIWGQGGRTVNIAGRIRLTAHCGVILLPSGQLQLQGLETFERNGDTGTGWDRTHHYRKIQDRFNNGDSILEYDNYRNSFDGAFAVDNRQVNDHGSNFSFDHNPETPADLGGYTFRLQASYMIDDSITLDQIKTAFDSI